MTEDKKTEKPAKDESITGSKPKKKEKKTLPEIKPGMTVKVHQKIKEKGRKKDDKEKIQIFQGIIIARKHGGEKGATITVRKISEGVGVEKIFPIHSPSIVKIEPVKQAKRKKAKLYYLRSYKKRLKEKKIENK